MSFLPHRVTASPSECLILMERGVPVNKGNGASAHLWPWNSYVLVPTGAVEYGFQMHQETSDGITLRFKGIAVYRIVNPELAATLFRLGAPGDQERLSQALADICMGELRAIVAGMSMAQCLGQRKTVLTAHLQDNVLPQVQEWGLKVDVLQVAQVFCADDSLLAQIQAEAKDRIRQAAQASEIETAHALQLARLESARELDRRRVALEADQLDERRALKVAELESREAQEEKRIASESRLESLQAQSGRAQREREIEAEGALRRLELQRRLEAAELELRLQEAEAQIAEITTRTRANRARARMEVRKEILPLEQLPQVSQSLAGLFKDARLTFYGDGAGPIGPALQLLLDQFREVYESGFRGSRA